MEDAADLVADWCRYLDRKHAGMRTGPELLSLEARALRWRTERRRECAGSSTQSQVVSGSPERNEHERRTSHKAA